MNFIGIDFGTSNSLAALGNASGGVDFVRFPDGKTSNSTVLYFPNGLKKHFIGDEAIRLYVERLEQTRDAGRLMLSIKSLLPEKNFEYTTVAGFGNQTAADLAARFIGVLKDYAEEQIGTQFDGVVLGRPVDFNELAVRRLGIAAELAGFKKVVFWMEPVAAALAHELTSQKEELICVVDLGGGTSDIAIVATSPARSLRADRESDIKAARGVNQAGDEMNARIMRGKLAQRFGLGSTFRSLGKELPFPVHMIEKISKWHRVGLLRNPRDIQDLIEIKRTSDRPDDVNRIFELVRHNYGFELFQAIDGAKRVLSDHDEARIRFRPLELDEMLLRVEFEELIVPVVRRVADAITECLNDAGVTAENIDRVILTGGSSQIPMFEDLVRLIFGEEKIERPDYFASVATGLGLAARRLSDE